ncbi:ATP-binding cassette domain-containing protein, partial [Pseudomonas viridiflava]|uniref:ATP-binding cassette domain-containing protein n=1 Tax=Pseudomonas viridiflava TaxID=33069 RepID=UPI0019D2D1E0
MVACPRSCACQTSPWSATGATILDAISWEVQDDERWVVLGANGAGKTTLLQVAGAQTFPPSGDVEVLGTE